MNPIFGTPDVYRNRYYGAMNAGAPQMEPPSDAGTGGIFSQRRQQANSGSVFTPPPGGSGARPSGTGSASNMTGAPTPPSNMTPDSRANTPPSNPVTSAPPVTPAQPPATPSQPIFAPTAAQVSADSSAYAGTSFDPNAGSQFRPPTGLANSTTANTRDSNGDVIRGYQTPVANPARGADPSTIQGWVQPGTTPYGVDPTSRNALGTQRNNQTLIYGPYRGTWGYRWVDNGAVDSGQAFVDAIAPNLREGLQVTPEWIAQQRRFYGVR